jgi:hypothetical protein
VGVAGAEADGVRAGDDVCGALAEADCRKVSLCDRHDAVHDSEYVRLRTSGTTADWLALPVADTRVVLRVGVGTCDADRVACSDLETVARSDVDRVAFSDPVPLKVARLGVTLGRSC